MPRIESKWAYTKGLHDLGNGCYAYLQPDGSWGWSNAGLVSDSGESLLVDTANRGTAHLFIVNPLRKLAAHNVDSMLSSHPPIQERIARLLALTR